MVISLPNKTVALQTAAVVIKKRILNLKKKEHWKKIYLTKLENEVSWYQQYPKTSMELINLFDLKKEAAIIDSGGGDNYFAVILLEAGFSNTVLTTNQFFLFCCFKKP